MTYHTRLADLDGFGHCSIATGRLAYLLATLQLGAGEGSIVTVSSVTGNLLIHRPVEDGEPGDVVAVVNLAAERVEWSDEAEDGS